MHRFAFLSVTFGAACVLLALGVPASFAQRDVAVLEPEEAQAELERATRESQRAESRAERLAREADEATEAADKTAREAASVAAQIQAAEADIAAARARYSLAQADRQALSDRLALRQQPLVRLTGALQTTARRPLALSALQPGSLKELVYVRAVLDSAVPQIRQRTSALRGELEQGRLLEQRAAQALAGLRESEQALQARRAELTAIETRQRLASRDARSNAAREGERAEYTLSPERGIEGYTSLVSTLVERGQTPDRVVHLSLLEALEADPEQDHPREERDQLGVLRGHPLVPEAELHGEHEANQDDDHAGPLEPLGQDPQVVA